MKLEEASLALESRSVGACIDIAILFYRHHIGKLLPLSFIFGAVPVTFGMLGAANGNGWILSGLLFLFVSPFLGVYALVGALLIVVLAFILKTALSTHRQKSLPREDAQAHLVQAGATPGETPPEQYWARAEKLQAQKDYKGAIRELLLGAMSATERRGLIRHRRGLTNRGLHLGGARRDAGVAPHDRRRVRARLFRPTQRDRRKLSHVCPRL